MSADKTAAGDEHMGAFVYCTQHLRPHSTGWCTVAAQDKKPLKATTAEEAYAEVIANGWEVYHG